MTSFFCYTDGILTRKKLLFVIVFLLLIAGIIFLVIVNSSAKSQRASNHKASLKLINESTAQFGVTKIQPLDCYLASRKFEPSPTYCQVVFNLKSLSDEKLLDNYIADIKNQGWTEWWAGGRNSITGKKTYVELFKTIKSDGFLSEDFNCDITVRYNPGEIEGRCLWEHKGINSLYAR